MGSIVEEFYAWQNTTRTFYDIENCGHDPVRRFWDDSYTNRIQDDSEPE